jgi:hypothetical protein
MSEVATKLKTGTVVDRAALNRVKSEDLAAVMAGIYTDNTLPVHVIDNVPQFFSDANLFKALDTNADTLKLILEYRKVELTEEAWKAIELFAETKAQITAALLAQIPYQFATVPDGWSLATHIKFNTNTIRRLSDSSYSIGNKALGRVWAAASRQWSGGKKVGHRELEINAGGYSRWVEVADDRVNIGCQNIRRYELEQVALHLGWAFPATVAAKA